MSAAVQRTLLPNMAAPNFGRWHSEPEGVYWRLVDIDSPVPDRATNILDRHESERAQRFRFPRDRSRYVEAHTALRMSLSEVLGQEPRSIRIVLGAQGKPMLAPEHGWVFNLSHSEGVALIAIAPVHQCSAIGVDVEVLRPVADWEALARENFSEAERQSLANACEEERSRSFLRCWTRKEACVKALGTGLTLPAQTFTAGVRAEVIAVAIDVENQSHLVHVRTLFESDTCIAAVACCRGTVQEDNRLRETTRGGVVISPLDGARDMSSGPSPLKTGTHSWN